MNCKDWTAKSKGKISIEAILFIGFLVSFVFSVIIAIDEKSKEVQAIREESRTSPKLYIDAFEGQHKLQKMRADKETQAHIQGSFGFVLFGGGGGIRGEMSNEIYVYFSWEYKDPSVGSIFILDKMKYRDILVKFEDIDTPTIEFNHKPFVYIYIRIPQYCTMIKCMYKDIKTIL